MAAETMVRDGGPSALALASTDIEPALQVDPRPEGDARWSARLWTEGAQALCDAELVAAVLAPRRGRRTALEVAHQLLAGLGGLEGLGASGPARLAQIRAVGRRGAARLAACAEIGRRIRARSTQVQPELTGPAAVAAYLTPRIGALEVEQMWVVSLDGRNRMRGARCVAHGGQHGCAVTARDILRLALSDGASGFVLVHNHPSGEPTPSQEDLAMTRAVAQAAEVVGLPLLDHVIVTARGDYCSLLERDAL